MAEIKRILLTTDFSETSKMAFDHARLLAERFGGRIVLAYVEEDRIPPFTVEFGGPQLEEVVEAHRKHAVEALATMARQQFPDVEVETRAGHGVPHREIVRLAEREHIDVIVMATHGRGFVSHALYGSTTERVVRHAPCPVLTVPGRGAERN